VPFATDPALCATVLPPCAPPAVAPPVAPAGVRCPVRVPAPVAEEDNGFLEVVAKDDGVLETAGGGLTVFRPNILFVVLVKNPLRLWNDEAPGFVATVLVCANIGFECENVCVPVRVDDWVNVRLEDDAIDLPPEPPDLAPTRAEAPAIDPALLAIAVPTLATPANAAIFSSN